MQSRFPCKFNIYFLLKEDRVTFGWTDSFYKDFRSCKYLFVCTASPSIIQPTLGSLEVVELGGVQEHSRRISELQFQTINSLFYPSLQFAFDLHHEKSNAFLSIHLNKIYYFLDRKCLAKVLYIWMKNKSSKLVLCLKVHTYNKFEI